jgi:hypothetical protein
MLVAYQLAGLSAPWTYYGSADAYAQMLTTVAAQCRRASYSEVILGCLMVIEHDDIFFLGDHPVVLQHTETPTAAKPLGFDIEGVEAFMPLSPKCVLYMPCTSISRQIIGGYQDALAAPENLRRANEVGAVTDMEDAAFLALAHRVQENSGPLYESLTRGVALIASPENVENVNYLQCAWAHTAIYANRRDFTFPRHVFKNTPQYRGLVNVSLGFLTEPPSK